ncbi:MAG: hypothetical protein ACLUTO_00405 [Anaerostipes sp.]
MLDCIQLTKDLKWKNLAHDVGEVLAGTKVKNHWEIAFDLDKTKSDHKSCKVILLELRGWLWLCCRFIVWRKMKMGLQDWSMILILNENFALQIAL